MNYRMIAYIIGSILRLEGLMLVAPTCVAAIYQESDAVKAFFSTIIIVFIVGSALAGQAPKNKRIYGREAATVVALSWIVVSVFGAVPFFLTGYISSPVDCFFEAVSGFTTTGASILSSIEVLPNSLLFWRAFTQWIGGMGILVFMLAIIPMGDERSTHLMRAEVPGPIVRKIVPRIKSTAKILYSIYVVLTLIEVVVLCIGGMPFFDSVVTAISTAATGGSGLWDANIAVYNSPYVEYALIVFMFLFSINFNMFYMILIWDLKDVWKNEELRYFVGIALFAIISITTNIAHLYPNLENAFRHATFQVVSLLSTSGFVVADYEVWPEFSKSIMILLMMLGGCGGSTSGGIKISRVIILLKLAVREVRHIVHPRSVNVIKLNGQRMEESAISGVVGYMTIYFFILFASTVLISLDNVSFEVSFTSVLACISNEGPAFGPTGPMGNFGFYSPISKIILCFNMLIGRLEIFPVIMLFAPSIWRKSYM